MSNGYLQYWPPKEKMRNGLTERARRFLKRGTLRGRTVFDGPDRPIVDPDAPDAREVFRRYLDEFGDGEVFRAVECGAMTRRVLLEWCGRYSPPSRPDSAKKIARAIEYLRKHGYRIELPNNQS